MADRAVSVGVRRRTIVAVAVAFAAGVVWLTVCVATWPEPASADASSDQVRFRFADGRTASGLALYRADLEQAVYAHAVRDEPAVWTDRLGAHGELGLSRSLDHGNVVAIRASDVAQHWRPSDPQGLSTYALEFCWLGGTETTTEFGPWERLSEPLDLGGR